MQFLLFSTRLLIFNRLSHTYILWLSLLLGLLIGFAYRRLIWSAFWCSNFFSFSLGLQTWQIQVPGGGPNTELHLGGFINSEEHIQYIHLKRLHYWRELARIPPAYNDNQLLSTKQKSIKKTLGQFSVPKNRLLCHFIMHSYVHCMNCLPNVLLQYVRHHYKLRCGVSTVIQR